MSAIHALPLLIQMDNESHCDIPSISKLFYSFQCIASLFSRQVTLSITLCHLFAKLCIYLLAKRKERKSCSVLVQWILICSNRSPEKGFVECNRINDNLQLAENTIYVEELPIPAVIFCCVVFTYIYALKWLIHFLILLLPMCHSNEQVAYCNIVQ